MSLCHSDVYQTCRYQLLQRTCVNDDIPELQDWIFYPGTCSGGSCQSWCFTLFSQHQKLTWNVFFVFWVIWGILSLSTQRQSGLKPQELWWVVATRAKFCVNVQFCKQTWLTEARSAFLPLGGLILKRPRGLIPGRETERGLDLPRLPLTRSQLPESAVDPDSSLPSRHPSILTVPSGPSAAKPLQNSGSTQQLIIGPNL